MCKLIPILRLFDQVGNVVCVLLSVVKVSSARLSMGLSSIKQAHTPLVQDAAAAEYEYDLS